MPSIVPLVKIKLDKMRHLRLDLNAMVAYERASGERIDAFSLTPSKDQVRCLLWACLLHEDKEITLDDVGAMVYVGNYNEIWAALSQTVTVAQPEVTEDSKN